MPRSKRRAMNRVLSQRDSHRAHALRAAVRVRRRDPRGARRSVAGAARLDHARGARRANGRDGGQSLLRSRDRRAQPAHRAPRARDAARSARASMLWATVAGLAAAALGGLDAQPAVPEALADRRRAARWSIRSANVSRGACTSCSARSTGSRRWARTSRVTGRHRRCRRSLLFVAVTLWVAGFDIIYALMDFGVDRAQGISSLPARFGETSGRVLPIVLHAAMLAASWRRGLARGAGGRTTPASPPRRSDLL